MQEAVAKAPQMAGAAPLPAEGSILPDSYSYERDGDRESDLAMLALFGQAHLDDVLAEFDHVIGLDRLRAIHLNDSLNPRGSHKDRHARIGEGCIGLEPLVRVINEPRLCRLPFILETPNDHDGYAKEIALLRSRFQPEGGDRNA